MLCVPREPVNEYKMRICLLHIEFKVPNYIFVDHWLFVRHKVLF